MIRTSLAVCAVVFAWSACSKHDDVKPAPPAAEPTQLDQTSGPAPTATISYATAAEYEAKATPLMAAVMAVFAADGTSCDKLGADMTKLVLDNKQAFRAAIDYEHAHPADKKVLAWSSKEYLVAAMPSINACRDNKAFSEAMLAIQM
jgi:hypothetical protein